ncbi:HD domain-containing protein [Proteiniclasticum sp. C24MP]|uniref:HD domain-containing protein n=1 Tax=Proteiniclasticum sp. C24MP TaxID=3374101 RepID=UPI00375401D1
MGSSKKDREIFEYMLKDLLHHEEVLKMKGFIQHGDLSTYDHAVNVAWTSYRLSKKLGLKVDDRSLLRGALLHDFYLYDWHVRDENRKRFHGFHHPRTALRNAKRHFSVNEIEEDIILKHMWPLTLKFPKYRESFVVMMADKICSIKDTLGFENSENREP